MYHQLCLIGKLAMRLYYSSRTGLRTHLMMIACIFWTLQIIIIFLSVKCQQCKWNLQLFRKFACPSLPKLTQCKRL